MNANNIEAKFAGMGARFKLQRTFTGGDFAIDIQHDRVGEFFEFRRHERVRGSVDLTVLQTNARDRHLLLLVRNGAEKKERSSAAMTSVNGSLPPCQETLPRSARPRTHCSHGSFAMRCAARPFGRASVTGARTMRFAARANGSSCQSRDCA